MQLFEWFMPHCKPIEEASIPLEHWTYRIEVKIYFFVCKFYLLLRRNFLSRIPTQFLYKYKVGYFFSYLFSSLASSYDLILLFSSVIEHCIV